MKVSIDKKTCIGCGACAAICPDVFELKGDKAQVKKPDTDKPCTKQAADSCPVNAIKIA